MFDSFSTTVSTDVITFDTIKNATGLEWERVNFDNPQIPAVPGIYVWVDKESPHGLRYHGSGAGQGGLSSRLRNQLRWRTLQRDRLLGPDVKDEQWAYDTAREVPAVQQAVQGRLLYYAVARPAPWDIERSDIDPPATAIAWEAFISAVSLLVLKHRGLIGGGAWESKSGTIAQLMTDLAWDRLVDINGETWV